MSSIKEEKKTGGFETVEVQTNFLYKGKVEQLGDSYQTSTTTSKINVGDVVVFAKYSPHTQTVDVEGEEMKIIKVDDILAVW